MNAPLTTRAVRLRAAELLEERGWWQAPPGTYTGRGPQGELCIGLALWDAAEEVAAGHGFPFASRLFAKARDEVLAEQKAVSLRVWNDARERTKAEVLAALRGGGA